MVVEGQNRSRSNSGTRQWNSLAPDMSSFTVTIISISIPTKSVKIKWPANNADVYATYVVEYRCPERSKVWQEYAAGIFSTSYLIQGLNVSKYDYEFRVRLCNRNGLGEPTKPASTLHYRSSNACEIITSYNELRRTATAKTGYGSRRSATVSVIRQAPVTDTLPDYLLPVSDVIHLYQTPVDVSYSYQPPADASYNYEPPAGSSYDYQPPSDEGDVSIAYQSLAKVRQSLQSPVRRSRTNPSLFSVRYNNRSAAVGVKQRYESPATDVALRHQSPIGASRSYSSPIGIKRSSNQSPAPSVEQRRRSLTRIATPSRRSHTRESSFTHTNRWRQSYQSPASDTQGSRPPRSQSLPRYTVTDSVDMDTMGFDNDWIRLVGYSALNNISMPLNLSHLF